MDRKVPFILFKESTRANATSTASPRHWEAATERCLIAVQAHKSVEKPLLPLCTAREGVFGNAVSDVKRSYHSIINSLLLTF